MADEFDLKPTSRGEEFLDVILRSLGGDTPDIPQPAWRYEEYLAAIANAIQNGGGSSGGGALVVNVTGAYGVCDKTAGEMFAAFSKGPIIINYDGEGVYEIVYACIIEGTSYTFNTMENQFKASSAEGYPSI